MKVNPFFRRINFLTHKKVQFQLASIFLFWFLALIGTFVFIFFMNFKGASERTASMSIHDQLLTKLLLVDQTKDLAIWYGIAAFGYIALIWTYVLVYTHRLTGPIYKLTNILNEAAQSKKWPTKPLVFRKSDAFPELAEAFNRFSSSMSESEEK